MQLFRKNKRIYLDHAAATPVAPEVARAMRPYFSEEYGNASAIHAEGVAARRAIEDARAKLARLLRVRPSGVIFTASGTESNNLALFGVVDALIREGRKIEEIEIIATAIEHPSILRALEVLAERGVTVRYVSVGEDGRIDVSVLEAALSIHTALVVCSYVNSEVGTVEDVKRVTHRVRTYAVTCGKKIHVHLDASQAPLWLPIQMDSLGVSSMTLDAGKCYGPKGVGILALQRSGDGLAPQMVGGGQERGLRAGTENTPLIIGCVAAIARAVRAWKSRSEAVASLRDFLVHRLLTHIPGVTLNGSTEHRVANNVNISIPGIDSEYAVVVLDTQGVAASTKSACAGASSAGSSVVRVLTGDDTRATSSIRFSLGENTTKHELKKAANLLAAHVAHMRAFENSRQG
ncbi:cysteine desulfurase [Candidatus Kaiserbacteria bacterium]|nr:cysteine desulfurase [Candidatus Kaiserbacteria bacterium]